MYFKRTFLCFTQHALDVLSVSSYNRYLVKARCISFTYLINAENSKHSCTVASFPLSVLSSASPRSWDKRVFKFITNNTSDISWMSAGRHTKCLLFSFSLNKYPNLSNNVSENPIYQISLKFIRWESRCFVRTDRQTDSLVVAFFLSQRFGNAPERRKTQFIWSGYWPRLTWIICMYVCVCVFGLGGSQWKVEWVVDVLDIPLTSEDRHSQRSHFRFERRT